MIRVGIPRALLFYTYFPLWRAFFTNLNAAVVVSPKTNKTILDSGLQVALDEVCLPVKLYFGHVQSLSQSVDYLFIPRLVSVEPKAYICPKFMGLPDMLRARLPQLPPLIDDVVDFRRAELGWNTYLEQVGKLLTPDKRLIKQAYQSAWEAQRLFQELLCGGAPLLEALDCIEREEEFRQPKPATGSGRLTIGLLGHAYNIYDSYINMNLINRLQQQGAQVVTADNIPVSVIEEQAARLPKKLFWTLGKKTVGAALTFFDCKQLDGVIYLTSFGCGPGSIVGELIERWAKRRADAPFMLLTIDEHSGAAGLLTRLEAFTDMLLRRKKNEADLSAHGQSVYSSQGAAVKAGYRPDASSSYIQKDGRAGCPVCAGVCLFSHEAEHWKFS